MRNQDLPPHYQLKRSPSTRLEDPSLYTTPLRSLKKRASRKLVVIIGLIASTAALLRFPPSTVLYTWTAQNAQSNKHPHLAWASVMVNVKDGSREWKSKLHEMPSPSFNYQPKSAYEFDEALEDRKLSQDTSPSRAAQVVDLTDTHPVEAQSPETKEPLPIFDRLLVKEAPIKPYNPAPRMRVQPNLRYEDVRPSVHHLTRELESSKFLTFLPHSGFHNQRIGINNAFKLAKLLNRTLILPPFRLGNPVPWRNSTLLSQALERQEMKYERLSECATLASKSRRGHLDQDKSIIREECKHDSDWTSVQVDYVLNIKEIHKELPIIDRTDFHEAWLWNTLNLYPGEWLEVKDESRYSYQIYESATDAAVAGSKYGWRLNIDDLVGFSDTRLLSFGSLFGSERVILSSPKMENFNQKIEDNQLLNLPLLENISDQIGDRLGGRGKYIGLHLRVADGFFKVQAPQVIQATFEKICKGILKLDQQTVDDLIAQYESKKRLQAGYVEDGREHLQSDSNLKTLDDNIQTVSSGLKLPMYNNMDPNYNSKKTDEATLRRVKGDFSDLTRNGRRASTANTPDRRAKPSFKCNGKLHDEADGQLDRLNVPIYISTDLPAESIKTKEVFGIIFDNFPCVFSSKDLKAPKPGHTKRPRKSIVRGLAGLGHSKPKESAKTRTKNVAQQVTPGELGKESSLYHDSQDKLDHDGEEGDLYELSRLKSNLDGLNLDRFLFPVLESMIVSKGSHIIGTPRSTFSAYVENVLYPAYQRSGKSSSPEVKPDLKHANPSP